MAALHFLPGRKMHPTISHEFKTSLSPSLPSFCSFPLVPSRRLECQSTTVAGLNIIKCFHQQNTWSKGLGIPATPSQLTNIQAYGRSFSLDDDLEDKPENPERGQEIRDPNDGRTENKRPKRKGKTEAGTGGDLSNSVNIGLEIMGDGEHVVKIKRRRRRRSSNTGGSSSTHDEEVKRAKQMAQNAALLILHGELLQDMGKKLLAQAQASLHFIYGIGMPAAPPSDLQSD